MSWVWPTTTLLTLLFDCPKCGEVRVRVEVDNREVKRLGGANATREQRTGLAKLSHAAAHELPPAEA